MGTAPALAAIVLAGGRSSRMGSWKAALPWVGGTTLLAAHVTAAHDSGADVVIVGLPRERAPAWEAIAEELRATALAAPPGRAPVEAVWIDDPAAPPFATLQAALHRLAAWSAADPGRRPIDAILLTPVDACPASPRVVAALLRAFVAPAGPMSVAAVRPLASPSPEDAPRRGHPVLLDAAWAATLLDLDPATTRLDLLLRDLAPERIRDVPVDDRLVLANLNTPEAFAPALEAARARARRFTGR